MTRKSVRLLRVILKKNWIRGELMLRKNIIFTSGLSIVLIVLSITFGFIISRVYEKHHVYEWYIRKIRLIEDVELVNSRGEHILLHTGCNGKIEDKIDYWGDEYGTDFIAAYFDNGENGIVYVAIATTTKGKSVHGRPLVEIKSIESSQTILSEYKISRDKYYNRIIKTRIICVVTSFFVSFILSFIAILFCRRRYLIGKSVSVVNVVLVTLDVIILFCIIIGCYIFLNAM